MAKLSQEKIDLIRSTYSRLGSYAATAREVGCAASTVKKYVDEPTVSKPEIAATHFEGTIEPVSIENFKAMKSYWTNLTPEEVNDLTEFWREL